MDFTISELMGTSKFQNYLFLNQPLTYKIELFLTFLAHFELNLTSVAVHVAPTILDLLVVVDHPVPDVLLVICQMLWTSQSSSIETIDYVF